MRTLYSLIVAGKSKFMKRRKKKKRPVEWINIPHYWRKARAVGLKTSTKEWQVCNPMLVVHSKEKHAYDLYDSWILTT